jgi:hypothetical protein
MTSFGRVCEYNRAHQRQRLWVFEKYHDAEEKRGLLWL